MAYTTAWFKASKSAGTGGCVEMRRSDEDIQVRDSKHPSGPFQSYSKREIAAWLDGAKNGEFDHLLD